MRASEFIRESFNSKIPYTVDYANNDSFQTRAEIGGRIVIFGGAAYDRENPFVWQVAFEERKNKNGGSHFGKTNSGNEMQVFSFVLDSMRELIARYRPLEIQFTSSKSDENRSSLYARMIKRYPIEGYTFAGIRTIGSDDEFIIKRNDNL